LAALKEDPNVETVVISAKRPHGSKLKKKIVYVYDSDSDEDIGKTPAGVRPNINAL
jgi:hypothetical protein